MAKFVSEDSLGSMISLLRIINPVRKGAFRIIISIVALLLSVSIYIYFGNYYRQDDDFVRLIKRQYMKWVKPTYVFYGSNKDSTPYGKIESALENSRSIRVQPPVQSKSTRHMSGALRNAFGVMTNAKSLGIIQHDTLMMAGMNKGPLKKNSGFANDRIQAISPLYMERLHIIAVAKVCGYAEIPKMRTRDVLLGQCLAVATGDKGHLVLTKSKNDTYGPYTGKLSAPFSESFSKSRRTDNPHRSNMVAIKGTSNSLDNSQRAKKGQDKNNTPAQEKKLTSTVSLSEKLGWKDNKWRDEKLNVAEFENLSLSSLSCAGLLINESSESNEIHKGNSGLKVGTPGSSSTLYSPYLFKDTLGQRFFLNRSVIAVDSADLLRKAAIERNLEVSCDELEQKVEGKTFSKKPEPNATNKHMMMPVVATQVRMYMSGAPYPAIGTLLGDLNRDDDQFAFLIGVDPALVHQINKNYKMDLIPTNFRQGSYKRAFISRPDLNPDFLPTAGAYAWLVGSADLSNADKVMALGALGNGIERDPELAQIFSNPPISLRDIQKGIENEVKTNNFKLFFSFVFFLILVLSTTVVAFSSIVWVISTSLKTSLFQELTSIYRSGVYKPRRSHNKIHSLRVITELEDSFDVIQEFAVELRKRLDESWLIERHYRELMQIVDEIHLLMRQELERELTVYINGNKGDKTRLNDIKEMVNDLYARAMLYQSDYDRLVSKLEDLGVS